MHDTLSINQYFGLALIFLFMVVTFACWRCYIFLPFKLFTVFMHEMGHAVMAWVCCGKVTSITVQENESGLTNYTYSRNCVRYWVTPAGYVGSSVIGAGLIISAATRLGALIGSGIIAVLLLVTFFFQKNLIPRISTIVCVVVVAILWVFVFVGLDKEAAALRIVVLFVGTINGLYSVIDIYDDTVKTAQTGSDAVECATLLACPQKSKMVGTCWLVISFILYIGSIIVNIIIIQPPHD